MNKRVVIKDLEPKAYGAMHLDANEACACVMVYRKAKSYQMNRICERFYKTVPEEFYSIAFRKKVYCIIEKR